MLGDTAVIDVSTETIWFIDITLSRTQMAHEKGEGVLEASTRPVASQQMLRGPRYYLGITVFVLANALPLIGLVVVPVLGLSAGVSATLVGLSLVGGPDLLLIASAALLGRENLEYLLSKFGSWFKRLVKWDQVSRARYRFGIWIAVLSVLTNLLVFYLVRDSIGTQGQPGWGYYVSVAADIAFMASFFILGSEYWAKIQALFSYDAHVVVGAPEDRQAAVDPDRECS